MRKATGIVLICCLIGFWVLRIVVAYHVQDLEEEISAIERQVVEERQSLHVLQAEWSYLTRPARLEELATQVLGMKPMEGAQRVAWADVPYQPHEATAPPAPTLAEAPSPPVRAQPTRLPAPAKPAVSDSSVWRAIENSSPLVTGEQETPATSSSVWDVLENPASGAALPQMGQDADGPGQGGTP